MWSDAGCTYASLQYQPATAVALSAGQYIGVAPGEYVHITLGDDNTDTQVTERIDQMLSHKMPQETGDDAAIRRRMKARKQPGADMMTERVIREINREKQLLAEHEPLNMADWDEAILTELGQTNDDAAPTDLQSHLGTMDKEPHDQQPDNTAKPTPAHPRLPHQAQTTKAHNKTPENNPHKNHTPTQKEEGNTNITTNQPASRRYGCLHRRHQTQREREGAVKGKGKK